MNLWQQFYNSIRDESWPDCINEKEFVLLPPNIQQEILELHNGKRYINLDTDDIEEQTKVRWTESDNLLFKKSGLLASIKIAHDFAVYFAAEMEGGGSHFGQNYPRVLQYLYPDRQFDHCLEWCAGAAFIGYRILSDGLCRQLTLLEAYEPAIHACETTRSHMPDRCQARINIFHGDKIQDLDLGTKFDLVVGNPPHFLITPSWFGQQDITNTNRLCVDKDWQAHREFFNNIKPRLAKDGVIVLQENINGSSVYEFVSFIESNELRVGRCIREKVCPEYWYLEVLHAE